MSKPAKLSANDTHALACFFTLHHASLVLNKPSPRPGNIERVVMATFGLVEKRGPFRLTARGKRAVKLAKDQG